MTGEDVPGANGYGVDRLHPRHIVNPNSPSQDVIVISSGCTIPSTAIIPASWYLLHQRSRPLADSIPISSSPDELHWSVCLIRRLRILFCRMIAI